MAFAPDTWPRQFRDLIRLSNKYLLNPVMLLPAGRRCWYASVVHHTGRRSGKKYSTPVVADRVGGQFIHLITQVEQHGDGAQGAEDAARP